MSQVGSSISGTVLMPWYLRSFGARVGSSVYFDAIVPAEVSATGGSKLVVCRLTHRITVQINIFEFGDRVVIEDGAVLIGHVVDNGYIQHAPTSFGHGTYVGAGSVVQPGSAIGLGVHIMPLSLVMKGESGFAKNSWWQGLNTRKALPQCSKRYSY